MRALLHVVLALGSVYVERNPIPVFESTGYSVQIVDGRFDNRAGV